MRHIALILSLVPLPLAACSTTNPFVVSSEAAPSALASAADESASRSFVASFDTVWQAAEQTADDLGVSDGYRRPEEGKMVVEDASDADLRIEFATQGRMTRVHARGASARFFLRQLEQNLAGYASVDDH